MGSNVGKKLVQCQEAVSEILKIDRHKLLAQSSYYRTEPVGYADQDWFVNGVIKIETDLTAHGLLRSLKAIESHLGRRETFRSGGEAVRQERTRCQEALEPEERAAIRPG